MRLFIRQILLFLVVISTLFTASLFLIPNKRLRDSSLYSDLDKNRRLDSLPSPKIVFVGGSNMAFGLNSQQIEDSLHIPVVNMGLHAGLGMYFMLNEVKGHVKKGDILILAPEYHQFFGNMLYGEKVLVALLFDINPKNLGNVTLRQYIHLFPEIVGYATSKIFIRNVDMADDGGDEYAKVFKRNSFNRYGDESMHWNFQLNNKPGMSSPGKDIRMNDDALQFLKTYNKDMIDRGVTFCIIPPAFQKSSYINFQECITNIAHQLSDQHTPFEIAPQEFAYPDSLFFNTIYHLNKVGVDQRTLTIIEFIRKHYKPQHHVKIPYVK